MNNATILYWILFVAGALHRPQRSANNQSRGKSVNTSSFPYIEVLRGRDGRDGQDGVPGPRGPQGQRGDQGVAGPPGPRNGGVVYTRWGKSTCPSVSGTTLVYAGRAGGTWYGDKGGAANYLCMPDDPDYLSYKPGVQGGQLCVWSRVSDIRRTAECCLRPQCTLCCVLCFNKGGSHHDPS